MSKKDRSVCSRPGIDDFPVVPPPPPACFFFIVVVRKRREYVSAWYFVEVRRGFKRDGFLEK